MMRNQSGYPDPTAERAIGFLEAERVRSQRRPLIYICSPYRGNIRRNEEKAKKYCRFAVDQHKTPIAPHLLFPRFLGREETRAVREVAMCMGKQVLRKCRELWWFGDSPTEGMRDEIRYARNEGIIIRHFTEDCREVLLSWNDRASADD